MCNIKVCLHQGQVPFRTSVLFLSYFRKFSLVEFTVSLYNEPNPQPESAAVGSVTAISPFSKRVRRSACFLLSSWKMHMSFVVGPRAQ